MRFYKNCQCFYRIFIYVYRRNIPQVREYKQSPMMIRSTEGPPPPGCGEYYNGGLGITKNRRITPRIRGNRCVSASTSENRGSPPLTQEKPDPYSNRYIAARITPLMRGIPLRGLAGLKPQGTPPWVRGIHLKNSDFKPFLICKKPIFI